MTKVLVITLLITMIFGLSVGAASSISKSKVPQDTGCTCQTFSCGCCVWMDVPEIYLNDTACVNFSYDPKDYGIAFTFTLDGKTLINETISARNPPPICFPAPLLEDFFDLCIHFTNLDITNTRFHGCVQLEARMWWIYVVAEIQLGCFDTNNLPNKNPLLSNKNNSINIKPSKNVTITEIKFDDKSKYKLVPFPNVKGNKTDAISDMFQANKTFTNTGSLSAKSTNFYIALYTFFAFLFFLF